jgi:hypothetical protein
VERRCAGVDKVFVPGIDASQTMELVRELRAKGLVQGTDFNFSYQHSTTDFFDTEVDMLRGCSFTFTDPKWATFFRMKYGC